MLALASLLLVSVVAVGGVIGASAALRHAHGHRSEAVPGVLPFESGQRPRQHAVSRFHVRWYAVSVLFLAFDMEMVFMYPWAVVVADVGVSSVVEMFGFLAVLLVGVVYAWREGALRWS